MLMALIPAMASDWYGNKYSMFIHFGVYSSLGGVWKDKPVTYGYSEQIQACGGIYADQYERVAEEFNPVDFDADAIVALARAAGMRSIVITSKHHDGFCMWKTATTDYNSVEWAAAGRDFIREMADACERGGVNLGLYFSLIDWHIPYQYPWTTHNSDYILPQHHSYNMAQVEELCSNYGRISELWFDMGAPAPEQSRDLYELVHRLQPECMVGSRLGNDMYDFSVMGDNSYPDGVLQNAWQSPASMFNETWGYRSWQKRCPVGEKVAEKLRSLVEVVSKGGNFLLNIGPDDKGAVVPYEKEVLLKIGEWLAANGDVIYDTDSTPFREQYDWGVITRKGRNLNLILSGRCPDDGRIVIPDPDRSGRDLVFKAGPSDYSDPCDFKVIRHECRNVVTKTAPAYLPSGTCVLRTGNAMKDYSYSCQDYYVNFLSTTGYNWYIKGRMPSSATLLYTGGEVGRKVRLSVDGEDHDITLAGNTVESKTIGFEPADTTVARAHRITNYTLSRTVTAPEEGDYLFRVGAGNTLKVYVNDRPAVSHINKYRNLYSEEYVLLHLAEGRNDIRVECFNRHEKTVRMSLSPDTMPLYTMELPLHAKGSVHHISLTATDRESVHQDCRLHNVILRLE